MSTINLALGSPFAHQPAAQRRREFSPQSPRDDTESQSSQHSVHRPPSPGGDSLTLLPEVAATGRPAGSRRPFQKRRRSRACDACRARKTKCDTPDSGPCSACTAASLICKFSEGGEDKRRAGPARRVRALENQVEELTKKLAEADAQSRLIRTEHNIKHRFSPSPRTPTSPEFHWGSSSFAGSAPSSARTFDTGGGGGQQWWNSGQNSINTETQSETESFAHPEHPRVLGDSSYRYTFARNPSFIGPYKDYLRQLGYGIPDPDEPDTREATDDTSPSVPLISEYPSIANALPVDLRIYLPPKLLALKILGVFKRTIQKYTPLFYWPALMEKVDRAWEKPMWHMDRPVVNSVYCILQMLLAVSSQLVEAEELGSYAGDANIMQERCGWKFFHLARKYKDLNDPTYSLDDATYLFLMALYLDNASLPSPCWMVTGCTIRVCQDLNLEKNPPPDSMTEVEKESRNRLFWNCYIQDRKIAMKKGRRTIMDDSDVEADLPRILPEEDVHQHSAEHGNSVSNGTEAGDYGHSIETTFQIFSAVIELGKMCDPLIGAQFFENGGPRDMHTLQDIDERLKHAWESFPRELTDLQNVNLLDIGALRPLLFLQNSRLVLYRHFTDSNTANGLPLNSEFRTFCLSQSIQVSKITAHLICRAAKNEDFDTRYGLWTDELARIHTFRSAIVLLLGYSTRSNNLLQVSTGEVDCCVRALHSVARYHYTGKKLLELFDEFARIMGYHPFQQELHEPQQQQHHHEVAIGFLPPGLQAPVKEEVLTPYNPEVSNGAVPLPMHTEFSNQEWHHHNSQASHRQYNQNSHQQIYTGMPLQHQQYWVHPPPGNMHPQMPPTPDPSTHAGFGVLSPTEGGRYEHHPPQPTPNSGEAESLNLHPPWQGGVSIGWDAVQQALKFGPSLESYIASDAQGLPPEWTLQ